jgi:hypothetical protein
MKQVYSFYYQLYDPLVGRNSLDTVTIVRFSRSEGKNLFFSLYHFPQTALEGPVYEPKDESMGCINLDREGINEFIQLLHYNWRFLR